MTGTAFVAPAQKSPATEAEQDLFNALRALVGSLNGETAFQRLVSLTGVDDDASYAVTIQNQGAGGHLTIPGIMDVTSSGVVIGALSLTTLTVAETATFNGNVTLGNASGDTITVTGTPTFSATATFNGTLRATSAVLLESTVMLGDAVGDTITVNGATTMNADLTFAGTGRRILGDFSNATVASRLLFQNSVVNGASSVSVIPNGTAVISDFSVYNSSNPAAASFGLFRMTSTDLRIVSSHAGASYLPITFYQSGAQAATILPSGLLIVGTATAAVSTAGAGDVQCNDLWLVNGANFRRVLINSTALQISNDGNSGTDLTLDGSGNLTVHGLTADTNGLVVSGGSSTFAASVTVSSGGIGVTGNSAFNNAVSITNGPLTVPAVDPPTANGEVTAGSQCKAYAYVTAGGSATLGDNYNIASVTRNGAGDFTVTLDRDFAAATYAVLVTVQDNLLNLIARVNGQAVGSFDVHFRDTVSTLSEPDAFAVACFGTLS